MTPIIRKDGLFHLLVLGQSFIPTLVLGILAAIILIAQKPI